MKSSNIGISDLIQELKKDLLSNIDNTPDLFSIDEVTLEISFTVSGDIHSGLNFGVVTLGSDISEDRVQKISVKMSPLFSKDQLVEKENKPDTVQTNALVRGGRQGSS